ncbi:hypothetical protein ACQ4M4_12570 [Leptolyngbya sp. AN02str]|uniref:hypothetical protein n=1 Tax=Leptolyngbya sp. AN02str TaxID=3423363 RepID=UPI003D314101
MTPFLIHRFWSFIEDTQSSVLLNLDDNSLERWLVNQFRHDQNLNSKDEYLVSDYIRSRIPLIREMAHERN